jgi:hypothetical protein
MKKNSSKYRDFIMAFSKISISKICNDNNISRSQLYNNELSLEKEIQLQEYLEKEISKLYSNF